MEFLAFGLLGLGAIFILIGVLSSRQGRNPARQEPPAVAVEIPAPAGTLKKETQSFNLPVEPVPVENPIKNIKISVNNENAMIFTENAVLYIDKSRKNIYSESHNESRILNMTDIHRIGPGKLSFDGFCFFFENKKAHEIYRLQEIDKLNLYKNCISLVQKQTGNTSIFFIDNTIRIQTLLEPFIANHAAQ